MKVTPDTQSSTLTGRCCICARDWLIAAFGNRPAAEMGKLFFLTGCLDEARLSPPLLGPQFTIFRYGQSLFPFGQLKYLKWTFPDRHPPTQVHPGFEKRLLITACKHLSAHLYVGTTFLHVSSKLYSSICITGPNHFP